MTKLTDRIASLSPAKRALLQQRLGGPRAGAPDSQSIRRRATSGPTPLSYAQQRIWFIDQLDPGNPAYNVTRVFRLQGRIHAVALQQALEEIVRRHEVLRSNYAVIDGGPVQVVSPDARVPLPECDLTNLPDAERWQEASRLCREDAAHPFDLRNDRLIRARLLHLSDEEQVLLLVLHHIASDAWSRDILARELSVLYKAFREGRASPLPDLPIQYADYAAWQRAWLQGDVLARQVSYWKEYLAGAPTLLELPTDRPRPPVQTFHGASITARFPTELTSRLKALGQQEDATAFMALLAAFQVLLSRYSAQEDIVVGTVILNRARTETESLIGCFFNSLAMRGNLSGDPSFRMFLRQVREAALGAYAHQDMPFEKLVEELQPERALSHSPIFQVLFTYQRIVGGLPSADGLAQRLLGHEGATAKFDLMLDALEADAGLWFCLGYSTDLFDRKRMEGLLGHFETLLEGIVADPDQRVSRLPLLAEPERRQLLVEWNDTTSQFPQDQCIHELFQEQVQRTPEAIALVFEEQQLTYAQLNARANQLAHYLRKQGVGPEALVGLCVERSIEMVVGLLGILKAGGAYVPLDPGYPPERLAAMLEDSGGAVLITQERLIDRIHRPSARTICLDQPFLLDAESSSNPGAASVPGSLAYAIFTSGSTGRPKAVQVCHHQVPKLIQALQPLLGTGSRDTWTVFHSYAFDFSVWEIWAPLLSGGRLVVVPGEVTHSPGQLFDLLAHHRVSVLNITPSVLATLLSDWERDGRAVSQLALRAVHCGGEALPSDVARKALGWGCPLWNFYGPTESTVWTTLAAVSEAALDRPIASVGRPFIGRLVYVVDRALQPVPVGVPGELVIGGEGLARGYLNRPDLTAERFVPDPFSRKPGARMYRTGDVCRYLPDGGLEFLGRIDHQVKVRGFRIELGEIESVLRQHPDVTEAVVLAHQDQHGETRLAAYVLGGGHMLSAHGLREYLKDKLPGYMVPGWVKVLDSLPLTPNGKVDRKALPAPDSVRSDPLHEYEAPQTAAETQLAGIWAEVLRLSTVGRHDSFFELGGHSLLATQVISRVRQTFQLDLPLRTLFEAPSVAGLAERIEQMQRESQGLALPPLLTRTHEGPLPLSFAQQRLWFLDQLEPGSAVYNIPFGLRLMGPLDESALQRSLSEIVRRHQALRTVFEEVDGAPVQVIREAEPVLLARWDLSELEEAERQQEARQRINEEAQRPFDLGAGPLLRASLLRLSEQEHVLLITMHHIVSDGWSTGVLTRELSTLYNAYRAGVGSPLSELPIQYADYAAWQREWLDGAVLEEQLAYWKEQLVGAPALLELPTDRPRPAVQTFRGASKRLELGEELAQGLEGLCQREGVTLFMMLLAAFQSLLHRYSGQDAIVVGTPIANRTRAEVEGLIGYFANTLALRGDLSGDPSFREVLSRVRESALGGYAHQDLPFEKLVEELQPQRSLSHSAVFQVMLTLQNAPRGALEMEDLQARPLGGDRITAKFDLCLTITPNPNGLLGVLEYSSDLFDGERMEGLLGHFETLLEGIVADPDQRVSRLPLLAEPERRQLLVEWNDTTSQFPQDQCIHELFQEQVQRTPEAIALVFEEQQLTYAQLNARANQLAHYLRKQGVGPEVLVGLCVERSIEMVVGLLGILKAGGAYVPLDPIWPPGRIALIASNSRLPMVITVSSLLEALPQSITGRICLDRDREVIARESVNPVPTAVTADNLAYVLHTSGSTGVPKGVPITHRAVSNFLHSMAEKPGLTGADTMLAVTTISFDIAGLELYVPWIVGARVVLASRDDALDAELLKGLLATSGATVMQATPATWQMLVDAGWTGNAGLKLLCGGEALPGDLAGTLLERGGELWNLYGPTETTIWSAVERITGAEAPISIGRPIANTTIRLLDRHGLPMPVGVPGELYIGGEGLARGYLNRPELTAERFVPDPFSSVAGARLYRTGDLARYQRDGRLECLGRTDHQVKVRGFRIELGEIESVLSQHPGVRDAVAMVRQDGPDDSRLAAYVVVDRAALASVAQSENAESQQVADWQLVWDTRFGEPISDGDPLFNISGWLSSYTGQPIPEFEMREWMHNTVDRILGLGPKRALEIGCGPGLLLFRIAPHCAEYIATDFAPEALRAVDRILKSWEAPAPNVQLLQTTADALDFSQVGSESPDTVILNSVIQYFPSMEYLIRVIEKAVAAVPPGGRIFIGDVRSLPLLHEFTSSVALWQASPSMDRRALLERAEQMANEEDELLINPAFFFTLPRRLAGVARAEVHLKRGRYRNEMVRFRYDVVLHVGPQRPAAADVMWRHWSKDQMSLSSLQRLLAAEPEVLAISGIPNARVADDLLVRELTTDPYGPETAADVRAVLEAEGRAAIDPEEVWALGAAHSYTTEVCPSPARQPGCFDVVFRRPSVHDRYVEFPGHVEKPWPAYANDPIRGRILTTLVPQLRQHLAERLPGYMVPGWVKVLDSLPLTPNGKVDRKALPAPDSVRSDPLHEYEAPQTAAETQLAGIWAEVLRLSTVGRHDSFFELGGHSLLATQVISRVRQTFQLDLPLRTLFEAPSVAGLAERIEQMQRESQGLALPPLLTRTHEGPLPLSFAQQRLWFLDQLEPGSAVYNIPFGLRLMGPLDESALQRSLSEIVRRHQALRTVFEEVDGAPVQVIREAEPVLLARWDLSELEEAERQQEARQRINEEAQRPFDLGAGPLLRASLLRLSEQEHVLLITMHHIVSDGWSTGVLTRELSTLYNAYRAGVGSPLSELPIQYADYAAWQREWLDGAVLEEQLAYWKEQLVGAPALLELPTDRPRPAVQTFRGASKRLELGEELAQGLEGLCQREGVTLFMMLLAAFQSLLHRYSGQDAIVVGTPIANRTRAEVEGLIGYFANTLALRGDLSGDPSFREVLSRVRESALGGYAHQDLPFEKLVEELQPQRSLSHSAVFQVMLTLQNAPRGSLDLEGLRLQPIAAEAETAKYDLNLTLWVAGRGMRGVLQYNTDLFDEDRMERFLGHYQTLLSAVVANPDGKVSQLPILREAERHQLLVEWNNTQHPFLSRLLHQCVEVQVDRSPDAPAIRFNGAAVSYQDLEERANRLAHYLGGLGVGTGSVVGVAMERSQDLMVVLLGVLKAGGAYLPIDPDYPQPRVAYMLRDAGVNVLVCQRAVADRLPQHGGSLICIDRDWPEIVAQPSARPEARAQGEDPAYVIYTSGSTGRPKGVVIPHRAILNHMEWMAHTFPLGAQDRVLQKTPISFDASVWECWAPLMAGAELVLAKPGGHQDPRYLAELVQECGITHLKLVPSLLQVLLEEDRFGQCASLLRVFCGAEVMSRDLQVRFYERFGKQVELHNLYGPTEAAIDATWFSCRPGWESATIPIGRPIANTRLYITGKQGELVPVGVSGELCIGGESLATGYLNRPDMTAERFVPDPFSATAGARLYRTGDLCRYLPDGNVEFLGRIDHQVKVRGFRIELGEIESVLGEHPQVREAVVLVREDTPGEKRLVGYVVSREGALAASELREHLKAKLPEYMVPSVFVEMESLPLSPNGKVDRKALPAPESGGEGRGGDGDAPQDALEIEMSQVFARVLARDDIGVNDSFFDLGGHSLMAVRLMNEICRVFGRRLPLQLLFQSATVRSMAQALHTDLEESCWSIAKVVTPLNTSAARIPMFCVAAPDVNALGYVALGRNLGADQPLVVLQSHYRTVKGLEGEVKPYTPDELRDLAAESIRAMRTVQPKGPYCLGGMCEGVHVAFEMARQLQAAGEQVPLLVSFDAWPEENTRTRFRWWLAALVWNAQRLMANPSVGIGRTAARVAWLTAQSIRKWSLMLLRPPAPDSWEAKYWPGRDFVPDRFQGSMTVFRVEKQPIYRIQRRDLGWAEWCTDEVTVYDVPGEHSTILREPGVGRVAAILGKQLADIEKKDRNASSPAVLVGSTGA